MERYNSWLSTHNLKIIKKKGYTLKTKYISLIVIFFIIVIFIIFSNRNNDTGRWYSEKQVKLGEQVFLKNCASCHGEKAEKTINWKKTLSDGSYPPPGMTPS